ncbi:MAG: T9SS type A sorting domain-containing protein [Flavobacteriales bacterium]|nr:T9SS type A sorting domain-containing protein [Flavobacteriales bacterium]
MATKHLLCGMCAIFGMGASAQSPITPLWSQTWPHGQDASPAMIPSANDNHLAFDPITGLVHVSIDAGLEGSVASGDQVFTFNAAGQDLSASPAPYVGYLMASKDDPFVSEGTADLAAYAGTVWALRAVNQIGLNRTVGSVVALRPDGSRMQIGLGGSPHRGHLLVDANGAIALRGMEQPATGIHSVTASGWFTYSVQYPFNAPPQDACLGGGVIYSMNSGLVRPYQRSNGLELDLWPAYSAVHSAQIAVQGNLLYYAYSDGNGGCFWGAETLVGATVWQRSALLGIQVEELHVDAFGRPWFIGNSLNEGGAPLLVVTASNGSGHETFTYGARMNDLVIGNGQAYITGQAEAGGTSTFLISLGTDLTTDAPNATTAVDVVLYPQPAQDRISISNSGRIMRSRVIDITGQLVPATLTGATVDVSRLSEGVYLLEAATERGLITRRFVISR